MRARYGAIPKSAAPVALLALCLGLTACGGGGSSSSTTGTSAKAAPPQATREVTSSANPKGSPPAGTRKPSTPLAERIPAKLKEQAGRAAPFLQAGADNSIPTYGAQGSGSERSEAQAALAAYLKAREAAQWARACTLMGKGVKGQLRILAEGSGAKAPSCAAAFATLAKYNPPPTRKSVLIGSLTAFRVKGDKGFALFYGPHRQQFMMPMVSEGGSWKVSQSIPIAYPVGSPVRGG